MRNIVSHEEKASSSFEPRITVIVASIWVTRTEDATDLTHMTCRILDDLYRGTFNEKDAYILQLHPAIVNHPDFQAILVEILNLKSNHEVAHSGNDGSLEGFSIIQRHPEIFQLQTEIFKNPVIQDCLGIPNMIPERTN